MRLNKFQIPALQCCVRSVPRRESNQQTTHCSINMEGHNLNSCLTKEENKPLLSQFVHSCIDEVCGHPGPTYPQFGTLGWSENEYRDTYQILLGLFKKTAVLYLDDAKMPQDFFLMPENAQTVIMDCLKSRRDQLSRALALDYSQKQTATVVDFDWRLKMVMGSSKLSSLRDPLLQLDLMVREKDEEKILEIEMDRDELDLFIKTLETANASLT